MVHDIRHASPSPVPGAKTAIGEFGRALPSLMTTTSSGFRCGTACAMACKSLSSDTRLNLKLRQSAASSNSYGRFVRCARPPMTGPATLKQAQSALPPLLAIDDRLEPLIVGGVKLLL